ncbi:TetR/AcrR family transcriptional regulator [Ferdinandcohnia sp. Marseille-Q9671]
MVKKQLIMEKALELFAKQGIEATSVQQITEHTGISKGAFYLSFKSKDELILALIDHFMEQITSDIDHLVKNKENEENLLFNYYYVSFQSFEKHSNFAKVLMKENTQSFNEELLVKMYYYDRLVDNSILSMIEQIYGDDILTTKYDLLYCIKGLMRIYSELLLFDDVPLDLHLLCQSLVEKTDLLARGMTVPFITPELNRISEFHKLEEVTREQLVEIIDPALHDMEDSIDKESLVLLKEQVLEQTFSPAIIKGLVENIRNNPQCKWISYLVGRYFKL